VLVNLVLPIISQWGSCEGLHFMQDGAPPHIAVLVTNHFRYWWIWLLGPTDVIPFQGVGPKKMSSAQSQEYLIVLPFALTS